MTKTLVHLPSPLQKRAFYLMLANAKQLQQDGEQVVLTHCDLSGGTCSANLIGSRLICKACRMSTRRTVESAGMQVVPLGTGRPEFKRIRQQRQYSWANRREIVDGVHSCLVTILRALTTDLNRVGFVRAIKRRYYASSLKLLESLDQLVRREKVDRIEVLNGRYACMKIGLVAAARHGIEFNTLDYNYGGHPMIFRGHTPHDRAAIQKRMLQNPADETVAAEYYNSRRDRRFNKFAGQHRHFRPPEVDPKYKRKITFFLSSQDECESLGPSWRSPFRDNAEVILRACEAYPETFFCVRFHPNQASILSDINEGFEAVEAMPNVAIFGADDQIDSYSLVDWSDVVVTFASTISVEACWQGKPVIQLGPSFYDQLGFSETPESTDAFLELLGNELRPSPKESIVRFANYELRDYDTISYLNCDGGDARPVGFKRRRSLPAKIAKEINGMATRLIQRVMKRQLQAS